MSWDLDFIPREALPEPGAWLEVERPVDSARARRQGEAVVEAIAGLCLEGPFAHGGYQLVPTDDSSPLTVDLSGHSAAMNVAYWEGSTAMVADTVAAIAQALARVGEYLVFDPQADVVVAPEDVRAFFLDEHAEGVRVTGRIDTTRARKTGTRRRIHRQLALVAVIPVSWLLRRLGVL
jgi:hypothetical protein